MFFINGTGTETSIVVVARAEVNENITLDAGSHGTDVEAALTATKDGLVRLEITGIPADTIVPYTLTGSVSGIGGAGKSRTFPSDGEARIVSIGCQSIAGFQSSSLIEDLDPHLVCHQGDMAYIESNTGVTDDVFFDTKADTQDLDNFYDFRRFMIENNPMLLFVFQNYPVIYIADDHDFGWNNVVDDFAAINTQMSGRSYTYTNAADWELARDVAIESLADYSMGNPINTDTDADTDAFYSRVEVGNTEVFTLSLIQASPNVNHMHGLANNTNPTLMGSQDAWFKTNLPLSTKKWILLNCQKAVLFNRNVNSDSFVGHGSEGYIDWDGDEATTRDSIGPFIHDQFALGNITASVASVTSDWHSPGVFASEAGVSVNRNYDHVSLIAGPTGKLYDVRNSDVSQVGDSDVTIFALSDSGGNAELVDPERLYFNAIGYTQTDDSQMAMQIITNQGSFLGGAAVRAGSLQFADIDFGTSPALSTTYDNQVFTLNAAINLSVSSNWLNIDLNSFTAVDLPIGLSISSTGVITGNMRVGGIIDCSIHVVGTSGQKLSAGFIWYERL